jgi:hypothetical protein
MQTVPELGTLASSTMEEWPPIPSQTICWQLPGVCAGLVVVGVLAGAYTVVQALFAHEGWPQSSVFPGQSPSATHWTQLPWAQPGVDALHAVPAWN